MKREDMIELMKEARKAGAADVKMVDVTKVKRGVWPRMKCQFGCPQYGKCLCCPPYTPDLSQMNEFLNEYTLGILVKHTMPIKLEECRDWQEFDIRLTNGLLDILLKVEKAAMMKNYYKAFALKAGRCGLCRVCNLKQCIHPESARPSLEACGIDVFALAHDNGFDTRVLTGPVKEVSVYGMLLVE